MFTDQLTFEGVWQLFKETDRKFQEFDRKLQESSQEFDRRLQAFDRRLQESDQKFQNSIQEFDRKLQESSKEFDRRLQAFDLRLQESDQKFQNSIQEFDRRLQESDQKFQNSIQEFDRRLENTERLLKTNAQETFMQINLMSVKVSELSQKTKELENLFTSQWGRLMESLVEGSLVRIFNDRGLPVKRTSTRVKGDYHGESYEFDILAHNGDAVVIVEVKTRLRPNDVKKFIKKLNKAKLWLSEYTNNQIYGAMAFLQSDAGAESMVINKNLFAIRAVGDSAHIINAEKFTPRVW
jgi:Holliday junction resolvase